MPNIKSIDMKLIDDLFQMGGGYVLDFSDRTMSVFFSEELNIDIDSPIYLDNGTSKAKRFRCFLNKVDIITCINSLKVMWNYRETVRIRDKRTDWDIENAKGQFLSLLERLQGIPQNKSFISDPLNAAIDQLQLSELKNGLLKLSDLAPHPRGYAFEDWLKRIFNLYKLEARQPFRLTGEQIDGSLVLQGETYLVEAKWQSNRTGVADLHTFQGKLEQKAAWTRGLFVSNSGFTEEGLVAFGRGKRVICMDGLDLFNIIDRELPLNVVLERKVRIAAETGLPFVRVRDLFLR